MKSQVKINLAAVDGGPFNCRPAGSASLAPESILCNDVVLPWERHCYNMRPFIIGDTCGNFAVALALVWATCEQDALDEACDAGLLESLLISDPSAADYDAHASLGNGGELHNMDNSWLQPVALASLPAVLLCAFAEARGAGWDTLEESDVLRDLPEAETV